MYDILGHHEAPLPDEINKQGFAVVTNPELAIQEQKMQMENAKAQREEQQRMEAARQAKLETDLSKLKDHTREADSPYFAKNVSDFNSLVQSVMPDYMSKDITKSTAAAMKIREAQNQLNSDIEYSNKLGQQEIYTDNLVDHNKPAYWDKEVQDWQENKKKSAFGDDKASIALAPTQHINIQKLFNDNYGRMLAKEGAVTGHEERDAYGNPTFIIDQTLKPERVNELKTKFLDGNNAVQSDLKKQIVYNNLTDAYKTDKEGEYDLRKRLDDVLVLPDTKETGRSAQLSGAAINIGLGGKGSQYLNVVNSYDKNTDTKTLTIDAPKTGYQSIELSKGDGKPQDVKRIELHKQGNGEPTATAYVIPPDYKTKLSDLTKINDKLRGEIEDAQTDLSNIKDKDSNIYKIVQNEITGKQERMVENEKLLSDIPTVPVEMDVKQAEQVLKTQHKQLTDKNIRSYFDKTKAEQKGLINFGVNGYDDKKTWQQMNGVKPATEQPKRKIPNF
jgi:hypothetical protein